MRYFEDVVVGEQLNLGCKRICKSEMLDFAKKYNRSYLHTNETLMKNTKYKEIISPGMFTFSIPWASFIDEDIFEGGEIGGTETTVQWFKGVYADDVLTSDGIITEKKEHNQVSGIVVIEIRTYNQDNKMVMKSINSILVRKRKSLVQKNIQ